MNDIAHWADRAHASRLRARRRRSSESRAAWRQTLRRRGVLAFVAAMCLSAGGAVAAEPTGSATLLKKGSRGPAVVAVQKALGIPADGIFGRQTRRAVVRFQRSRGLAVDGIVGPATRAALGLRAVRPRARSRTRPRSVSRVLEAIARCESGGNPRAVSADGRYRGKYQFSRPTWRALGGKGDPAKASEARQDRMAARLLAQSGTSPWPACARKLGL